MEYTRGNISAINRVIYTPGTPGMRERQQFDLSTRLEENNEFDVSGLIDLVGQTWNIYAVSALFGFQQDDTNLKLYSKRLREEIASNLSRENMSYDANFSLLKNTASRSNSENHPMIKIEVLAKTNNNEEVKKSIYKGVLLTWNTMQIEQNIQNSIRLPLLLCRGTRNCMDVVHGIVSRMFDCMIMTLSVKEDDLSWLLPIIIMSVNNEGQSIVSSEIQMEYIVPELPLTDTITVKFHTSDLKKILIAIIKNQDGDDIVDTILKREHIEIFYEVLHAQMLAIGGLQLGLCTLHRINLSGITIAENKLKIMNTEIMNQVLLYLNEKAFDTFHTLYIDV